MVETGCGVDEETVAIMGTLEDKVVGLLADTDVVVDCLGKVEADGTEESEDLIPGITAGCGSS